MAKGYVKKPPVEIEHDTLLEWLGLPQTKCGIPIRNIPSMLFPPEYIPDFNQILEKKPIYKPLKKKRMWLTRDYNGTLRLHTAKPERQGHVWHTDTYFGSPQSITLREDIMPNLKWTDKPIEISITNKKK